MKKELIGLINYLLLLRYMYVGLFAVMLFDYNYSDLRFSNVYYFSVVCVFFMFIGSFFQYQKSDNAWRLLSNLLLNPIVLIALFLMSAIKLETVIIDLAAVDISIFYLAGFIWLIALLIRNLRMDFKKSWGSYLTPILFISFVGYVLVLLLLKIYEGMSEGSSYMVWILCALGIIGVIERYRAMNWAKKDKKTKQEWIEFGIHLVVFIAIVIIYNYIT